MDLKRLLCLFIITLLQQMEDAAYDHSSAKTVRETIFSSTSYDPVTRPDDITNVKMSFNIRTIETLDTKNQLFVVHGWPKFDTSLQVFMYSGWIDFEWTDSRLVWTPASHGGLEYIFAKPEEIWKPELVVDNSVQNVGVISDDELHLRVKYTGEVTWEPPQIYNTHCEIDITFYPFDRQRCDLEIASWGYHKSEVTLEHTLTSVSLEDYKENGEWIISDTSVTTSELVEEVHGSKFYYPQLHFHVYLYRRPAYYVINTILPVIISSFLMVIVFILPAESGEKVSYALTVLLALAVLLTIIADHLPSTSLTTSVLGLYIAFTLLLAAFSVLATVAVLVFHHRDGHMTGSSFGGKVTRWAAIVTLQSERALSGGNFGTKIEPCEGDTIESDIETSSVEEEPQEYTLTEVVAIWDRFCFWFFLLLTILSTFVFMLVLGVGGKYQTFEN